MLRVAAYARVSTEKDDQINSLANQRAYFENYIKNRPDWIFVGVYYDEGVTGTQTAKRAGFNKMIEACRAGEIDLILTKEVSRFARNTVDALAYTRELRLCSVGVIFINDNIDTRDGDGEFRLSIMASVAQEESRKTSERVRWGQRRAMENGVVFGNNSIYGFTLKNGQLTVNDDEAEIVRLIFYKYVYESKGSHIIARELGEAGIKPPKASGDWSGAEVLHILKNEKYAGDLIQKKYITTDYLTHKKIANNGGKIYIRGHHAPIVDRAMWDKAREIRESRTAGANATHPYGSGVKIVCGGCGSSFTPRKSPRKSDGTYKLHMCRTRMRRGKAVCGMRTVNDKSVKTVMEYISDFFGEEFESAAEDVAAEIEALTDTDDTSAARISEKIDEVSGKRLRMLDGYFAGKITETDRECLTAEYDSELARLSAQLDALENEKKIRTDRQRGSDLLETIKNEMRFSESVYAEIIEKITVYADCLIVKPKYLDFSFRITYSTRGYKDAYTTTIESCDIVRGEN